MTYIFRRSVTVTFLTLNITLYSNILYLPGIMFAFRGTTERITTTRRGELFSHTYS